MQGTPESKQALVADVAKALYAAKICSYAQGMNIIKAKSEAKNWNIDLGSLARIWKVRGALNEIATLQPTTLQLPHLLFLLERQQLLSSHMCGCRQKSGTPFQRCSGQGSAAEGRA